MKEMPLLYEGQSVLIVLKNKDVKDEYFSKIQNVERKHIILSNPFTERDLPVKIGDNLGFFILEENDIYNFISTIENIKFGRLPELIIEKPKEFNHNQRRISLRFPLAITVKYEIKSSKSFFKTGSLDGTGLAKNISIGGILIETENKISDKSDKINVHFTLPAYPTIHVEGKITRIINNKDNLTEFAVNFENLDLHDRENIIRYIFNTQKKHIMEKTFLEKI